MPDDGVVRSCDDEITPRDDGIMPHTGDVLPGVGIAGTELGKRGFAGDRPQSLNLGVATDALARSRVFP